MVSKLLEIIESKDEQIQILRKIDQLELCTRKDSSLQAYRRITSPGHVE